MFVDRSRAVGLHVSMGRSEGVNEERVLFASSVREMIAVKKCK